SISPRCFLAESIQCIDRIDQMPTEELESKFHAWLNLDSPSGSDSRKCSFSVTSPGDMRELADQKPNGLLLDDDIADAETDLRRAKKKGTNLYGRPYCPGRPLSMKERLQIIEYHSSGMKVNAISKSLCISHGCVSKIITRYRLTGVLTPVSSPEHRKQRRRKSEGPMMAPASAGPSVLSPHTPPAAGAASVPQLSTVPQPLALHPLQLPAATAAAVAAASPPMPHLHFHHHHTSNLGDISASAPAALAPSMMYTDPSGSTYSFLQPVATAQLHHSLPHDYAPYYLYPTQ
ncbi:hypothetical protein PMAYCL1PPCAC_16349, partial [Pristionchus mayeri]